MNHKYQYISRYSNNKPVSAAQYITELICEKKAKLDKDDLHYRFWVSKKWSMFFRNQIATANKLLEKYDPKAIVNALLDKRTDKIYSLRAPHLKPIIDEKQDDLNNTEDSLTKDIIRKQNVSFSRNLKYNNIISKLEDLDNDS
jgi:hypothetical protein